MESGPPEKPVILASSSPYRKMLLERLQLPFHCQSPAINEEPRAGETATELVTRLAREKALAVAGKYSNGLVIGSDQVAALENRILVKPQTHDRAARQLQELGGRSVVFHTGVCVVNAASGTQQCDSVPFSVTFRQLSEQEIERYLGKEQAWDCAGSFKVEGLGISLLEKMSGEDITALIGLPLIRLSAMLRNEGLYLP